MGKMADKANKTVDPVKRAGWRMAVTGIILVFLVAPLVNVAQLYFEKKGVEEKATPAPAKPAARTPSGTLRLNALPGYDVSGKELYSEEIKINLGSYYIAPLVGQEGCVKFMVNGATGEPTCPGKRVSVDYESGKGEVVSVRIHSMEPRVIPFEFIPVRRSSM